MPGATGPQGPAGSANATGTVNYLSKFTAATTLGNSLVFDNGTNVGIGTTNPGAKLDVNGAANINGALAMNINQITGLKLESAAGAPVTCTNPRTGYVYFDSNAGDFYGCDGSNFVSLTTKAMKVSTSGSVSSGGTLTLTDTVGTTARTITVWRTNGTSYENVTGNPSYPVSLSNSQKTITVTNSSGSSQTLTVVTVR